jgi:hypothetical protein
MATNRREGRRLRAVDLHEQGWRQSKIAAALGVTSGAVCQSMRRVRDGGGPEALRLHALARSGARPDPTRRAPRCRGGKAAKLPWGPRRRPAAAVGDRGYASRKARTTVRQRGMRPVIPSKADEPAQPRSLKSIGSSVESAIASSAWPTA